MDMNAPPAAGPEPTATPPASEPVKRKRGRPPKIPVAPGDPAAAQAAEKPKRGRPPKKVVDYDSPEAKSLLAKQIAGLHMIAATATGIPELALGEPEAVMLAEAVAAMAREYDLALSGKTGAAIQLAAAAGMVYVPRLVALKRRVAAERAARLAQPVNPDAPPKPTVN